MPCPKIACCTQGWGCFYVCDLAFTAADRCRLSIFHLLWCCGYFCILKLTFAFLFISLWRTLPFRQHTIICVLGSLKMHEANKAAGLVCYWVMQATAMQQSASVRKLQWFPSAEAISGSCIQVVDFSWAMIDTWLYIAALVTFDVQLCPFLKELNNMRRQVGRVENLNFRGVACGREQQFILC